MYGFEVPAPMAVGSALCQQCGTAIASFLKYRRLGRGEPYLDLVMIGGSLMGANAGGRLLVYLNHLAPLRLVSGHTVPLLTLVINTLFVIMLTGVSLSILREVRAARGRPPRSGDVTLPGPIVTKGRIPPYVDLPHVALRGVSVPLLAYLGFVLGFLSGIMGVGGGVLLMPVLMYGLGLSTRNSAATGVLLLYVTVAFGTAQAALRGHVSLRLAMTLLVGSCIGAQIGAQITHRLPNRALRQAFAYLVGAAAVAMVWQLVRLVTE
jgi:uncharacterized membrane protein YfcA